MLKTAEFQRFQAYFYIFTQVPKESRRNVVPPFRPRRRSSAAFPGTLVYDHEHHEHTANAEIFHRTRTSEHASHITHRNRRHSVPATLHGYAFSRTLDPREPGAGNGEPVVKGSNARHRKRNGKKYARRHVIPRHFSFISFPDRDTTKGMKFHQHAIDS